MIDNHEMDRILNSPDYGVTQTQGISGILARLYRQTLMDLGMNPVRFQVRLQEFCTMAKHELKRNNSNSKLSKYYTVGNLRRELERSQMTFKVFMKGIRILKVKEIKFSIELIHSSGKRTTHEANVKLADPDMNDSLFDDSDEDKQNIISSASAYEQITKGNTNELSQPIV